MKKGRKIDLLKFTLGFILGTLLFYVAYSCGFSDGQHDILNWVNEK